MDALTTTAASVVGWLGLRGFVRFAPIDKKKADGHSPSAKCVGERGLSYGSDLTTCDARYHQSLDIEGTRYVRVPVLREIKGKTDVGRK